MANPENQSYDAIIYIPGLRGQPIDHAAHRIASAFDLGAQTPAAEFQLDAGQEEDYASYEGKSLKTRLLTIQRVEPGKKSQKVVDIYEFGYIDSLTKSYRDKNILKQALRLLLLLIINTPRLIGAFRGKKQKTTAEKLQYILAIGILSLLIGYLILLGFAVVDTVLQIPQLQALTAQVSATVAEGSAEQAGQQGTGTALTISQLFIIGIAAVEVFYPNLKLSFTAAAVLWISIIDYLGVGSRNKAVGGQLLSLIDHVAARGYRRIHIVAFSFGTIIALDNLFPAGHVPAARIRQIHTLVTIGCPFDLIRVFWPDYFRERAAMADVPKAWINVYSPIDIMASNFRNDPEVVQLAPQNAGSSKESTEAKLVPHVNVVWNAGGPRKRPTFFEILSLAGFEAHQSYWGSEFESESTAFSPVTEELYKNDFPLA